ncbi:MAG: ATPase [Acidobacteriota bacterium]
MRCSLPAALGLVLLLSGARSLSAQTSTRPATQSATQAITAGQDRSVAGNPGSSSSSDSSSSSSDIDQYWLSPPVVKLGAMLGMKPETASHLFQIINLLLLGSGIGYGLLKLLPAAFRRRNAAIQARLTEARTVTEEAAARLRSVEERLSRLDAEIEAIRLRVEADSLQDEQSIKAGVEEEKGKILAAAEAEIQSATNAARRELQRYAAELAIEQAERKLVVSAETDRRLVESFALRLGEGSDN